MRCEAPQKGSRLFAEADLWLRYGLTYGRTYGRM